MDELRRFCVRMLGEGPAEVAAEAAARASGADDREALLRAGVVAARAQLAGDGAGDEVAAAGEGLAAAVAAELRVATGRLNIAERELLALRELIGLDHGQLAAAVGVAEDRVSLALAGARLHLRTALRGRGAPAPQCAERERALEAITRRQDGLALPAADEDWLIDHLGHCRGCGQAHAAMLEATACYRAWAPDDGAADGTPEGGAGNAA